MPNSFARPKSFFKYLSSQTAKSVLKNQSIRWSSPLLFNDPFDVPRALGFGVTPVSVGNELMKLVLELTADPPEDISHLHKQLATIAKAIKIGLPLHLQKNLIAEFRKNFASAASCSSGLDSFRELWESLLPTLRILCLTDSPSHVAMWYHYADKYRGIVLEYSPSALADSVFFRANPVTYPEVKPAFYGASGWAEFLTMKSEFAARKLLDQAIFTKSPDWSYESEWRILTFANGVETKELFSDYKFGVPKLTGIYLGPLLPDHEKCEILEMAKKYPEAKLSSVSVGMARELIFTSCY